MVKDTESGIQLITRKKGAAPNAVRPAFATTTIRPRSGGRRAAGVTASLAKRGYRPDLSEPPCRIRGITEDRKDDVDEEV